MNSGIGSGNPGILAFDVGARIAVEMIARFPFFRSAALVYPDGCADALERLAETKAQLQLHIAQYDPGCTLNTIENMHESMLASGKQLNVYYYLEAHRFFFNPEHSVFHRKNTQIAWNRIAEFFHGTLSGNR